MEKGALGAAQLKQTKKVIVSFSELVQDMPENDTKKMCHSE